MRCVVSATRYNGDPWILPRTRMPTKRTAPARRKKRRLWTPSEIRQLKTLAGQRSLTHIARALGRTAAATRRQATVRGISLAVKRR